MLRICVLNFKKAVFLLVAFFALCVSVCAKESLITSVTISQPEELNGAYQLSINADKPAEYKQKVLSQNSMYFDLKNSLSADNLDTVYDNVSGVDALIVQQLENSKVRIYVNGENTSDTRLVFKTKSSAPNNEQSEITINRPIREYRPTNDINAQDLHSDINWDENSFNPEHLLSSVFGIFDKKSDMTLVICLLLLVGCVIVSKKIFAKVKIQEEPLIGLSSAYKDNFENLPKPAAVQNKILKQPENMQSRYKGMSANYSAVTQNPYKKQVFNQKSAPVVQNNSIRQNYALSAYQKSQKNPYTSATRFADGQNYGQTYQKRPQKPSLEYVSKTQSEHKSSVSKQGASVENIKFLESVTKIYEQSGRKDLAQGLKAGINKRKTAV